MSVSFVLKPTYLRYCERSSDQDFLPEDIRLHSFQKEMLDAIIPHNRGVSKQIFFVSAPVGSGKTRAFTFPTLCKGALGRRPMIIITEPTNAILDEQCSDAENFALNYGENIRVQKLTGSNRPENGHRYEQITQFLDTSDIILTNPDIISLYLTSFYLQGKQRPEKKRSFTQMFKRSAAIFFDEYHTYGEESLAKLVATVKLAICTGNRDLKFFFVSGTPKEKIVHAFNDIFGSENIGFISEYPSERDTGDCRKIRGRIEIELSDRSLIDVASNIPGTIGDCDEDRRLFLFDHVIDMERFVEKLQSKQIYPREISGFSDRASEKHVVSHPNIIVATNAVELGVDKINPLKGFIEPGLFFENVIQRIGRFGRSGSDATITIFVKPEVLRSIEAASTESQDFFEVIGKSFFERDVFISRVKRSLRLFLYVVWKSAPNEPLRNQIKKAILETGGTYFLQIHGLRSFIRKNTLPGYYNEFIGWLDSLLNAQKFFRGQNRNVEVILPRRDRMVTTQDVTWIKKNTYFEVADGQYIITGYRDETVDPQLTFKGPNYEHGTVVVRLSAITNQRKCIDFWLDEVNRTVQAMFSEDDQSYFHKEYDFLLKELCYSVSINTFAPSDVKVYDERIFF